MNCPCDIFEFPPRLYIPTGLPTLPRQIANFPEFRRALLHDVSATPALTDWRGRQRDDFGMMLIEMWAYVCDVTSFYDKVYADETYIRTAIRRESLRQLVALLGYLPRPAVGANVDLAAFADGRRAVLLPAGTAFRSDAFNGHPPQVYELSSDTTIHPLSNQWELEPRRPDNFGPANSYQNFLLCARGSVTAKKNDLVLLRVGTTAFACTVQKISDYNGVDGERYSRVEFDSAFHVPPNTLVGDVTLLKPSLTAGLWPRDFDNDGSFSAGGLIAIGPGLGTPDPPHAYLDAIYHSVRADQDVVFTVKNNFTPLRILSTSQQPRIVTDASSTTFKDAAGNKVTVPIPATTTTVTKLTLNHDLDNWFGFSPGMPGGPFINADISDIAVHLGFIAAGTVTVEALTTLTPADPLEVPLPLEVPIDADPPGRFQLEDKNLAGAQVDASLDYTSGNLHLGQDSTWNPGLTVPVNLFGNIITATRGESVRNELLGFGDATQSNQTFKLKKSPLTYLPAPTLGNDSVVASTLKVYVDGILWNEATSFFNVPDSAHTYIVRQNEANESSITFGNGVCACRLPTGSVVTAWYRFGAEAASPPAGGIHQIARSVKGLSSIRNPVAAYGGADAEPADQLRRFAPRSALLLGRAVSLADLEAATAEVQGVRNARAEWRWNLQRQSPVAQIYYIGDAGLDDLITQRLLGLTEPGTQIHVAQAVALPTTLALQITINPRYLEANLLAQVRTMLMDPLNGLLAPERIGIGLALFRSRICEFVCSVPGVTTIADLQLNNAPFADWGVTPGVGNYFNFETGALLLNGKAQ